MSDVEDQDIFTHDSVDDPVLADPEAPVSMERLPQWLAEDVRSRAEFFMNGIVNALAIRLHDAQ